MPGRSSEFTGRSEVTIKPSPYPGIVADPLHEPIGSPVLSVHEAPRTRTWNSASKFASACAVSGRTTSLLPKQMAGRARHGTDEFEDAARRQVV